MELQEGSKQLYIPRTSSEPHVSDNNLIGHSIVVVCELTGAD